MVKTFWNRVLDGDELFQNLPAQLRHLRETSESDNITLMGDYDDKVFQDFENTVFENYSENNNPQLFASEDYREDIAESDKIYEDAVSFFEYPGVNSQITDLLADTSPGDETAAFGPKEYIRELSEVSPDKVKGFYRK